eukprot:TRINITY_DN12274_c0_g1_i1.p1 TRINITY_DN12274_c0_g1~~TRINITY_DN12274_c0_g1_i1.p1  ORF type:complete len:273 (+),score=32.59 TRINITY_DN12274_c0_g1_i1:464-1282(+)
MSSLLTCSIFENTAVAKAQRKLLLDYHTCLTARWIPKEELGRCSHGWLKPELVAKLHANCTSSSIRLAKIIRMRGALSQLSRSLMDQLRFVHLVRHPLHTAQSRFVLGWHSYARQPEDHIHALVAKEMYNATERDKVLAAILLFVHRDVCQQILNTSALAAKLDPRHTLLLKFEEVRDDPHRAVKQVVKLFGIKEHSSVAEVMRSSFVRFGKRKAAVSFLGRFREHQWLSWSFESLPACRQAYGMMYPEVLARYQTSSWSPSPWMSAVHPDT